MTQSWQGLLRGELDLWAKADRRASFWWRDDDAVEASDALSRLLGLGARHRLPLCLAVIPSRLNDNLVAMTRDNAAHGQVVHVLQHGYSHHNHAPASEKKSEFPAGRDPGMASAELAAGQARLRSAFGQMALPVLAPPWNRMDTALLPGLAPLGFAAVSLYRKGDRPRPAAPGLRRIDCHADPIAWSTGGGFLGDQPVTAALLTHLQAKREGRAPADEPSGILTHHLRHDSATHAFLDALFALLAQHPAAVWPEAWRIFGLDPS